MTAWNGALFMTISRTLVGTRVIQDGERIRVKFRVDRLSNPTLWSDPYALATFIYFLPAPLISVVIFVDVHPDLVYIHD